MSDFSKQEADSSYLPYILRKIIFNVESFSPLLFYIKSRASSLQILYKYKDGKEKERDPT